MTGGACGSPIIFPERNWYLLLGKSNKRLGSGYFHQLTAYTIYEDGPTEGSKSEIKLIDDVLSKINNINGVKYTLPDSIIVGLPDLIQQQYAKERFGFITDEIESFFPELVFNDETTGEKYINYTRLIPVLVEAIKEQQKEIELLYSLQGMVVPKNSDDGESLNSIDIPKLKTDNCKLYQNSPNPYNKSTSIMYFIADNVTNAGIYIFNMQGTLLKKYGINSSGKASITINEGELNAGMYFYTLIAEGLEIDTKKMILTD